MNLTARRPGRGPRMILAALALSFPVLTGGCAVPFAAGVGLSEVVSIASVAGSVAFNKGASDLALDIVTGENCRIVEGLVREDRNVCEERGSKAIDGDFKGVVGMVQDEDLEIVSYDEVEGYDGNMIRVAVFESRQPKPVEAAFIRDF